ncbi:FAD-dependent monooxygenase [Streptomyces kebangsaanensis]|uniref:FAD-dependent monooxygenase n=1 Tax=Streptomyces kebangsaanensis TaxID=864058 RepID=A0ABW6KSZ9_9ACTN
MAHQWNTAVPMADVIVADGGINGLTAALAIARQRHRVLVLEREDSFGELETGIRLSTETLHALDRLDVGETVRELAVRISELRLLEGATGVSLAVVPGTGDDGPHPFSCPSTVVRRTELLGVLLARCRDNPHVRLRAGARVVRYEQSADRVTAVLENGERYSGDALVGAGGSCSPVHRQVTGAEQRPSHNTFYHSLLPSEKLPAAQRDSVLTVWASPGWQLMACPAGQGRFEISAHCLKESAETVEGVPVDTEQVLRECPDAAESVRRLLRLGEDWRMRIPCRSSPVDRWTDHRVVLTGDTDRPTLPFAAQNAGHRALEDAVHLGDLMDCDAADFPQVFRAYAEHRRQVAARARTWAAHAVFAEDRGYRVSDLYGVFG